MSDDIETGMVSMPDAVLAEMTRVRDRVLCLYVQLAARQRDMRADFTISIGLIRRDLDRAAKALAYQDAVELLRVLPVLRGWQP